MSYNRCKDIRKFGNKYLPSAYKTQVDFRSHFSGKKVRLIVREIRYFSLLFCDSSFVFTIFMHTQISLLILLSVRSKLWVYSRSLGLQVQIQLRTCMCVSCACCVLSGRGFYDELITDPLVFYRVGVIGSDREALTVKRPWPSKAVKP